MRLTTVSLVMAVAAGCSWMPRGEQQEDATAAIRKDAHREPSEQARALIIHALRYIGVPYRWGGDSPDTGFDCSGLVWRVFYDAAGVSLPRDSRTMSRAGEPVMRGALRPGDLVFFNTLRRPYSHVGIYLGQGRFIHAPGSGGRVEIISMSLPYWRARYDGARRIGL